MLRWRGKKTLAHIEKTSLAFAKRKHLTENAFALKLKLLNFGLDGADVGTIFEVLKNGSSVHSSSDTKAVPQGGVLETSYEYPLEDIAKYDFLFSTTSLPTGEPISENAVSLWVTDSLLAKGDADNDLVSFYALSAEEFGTQFDFVVADTLTGISIWYVGNEPGLPVNANLRFFVRKLASGATSPSVAIYQSPDITLTSADTASMVFHPLETPLPLPAGAYVVTARLSFSGNYRLLGYDHSRYDPTSWASSGGSWYPYIDTYAASTLRLHLNTQGLTPAPEVPAQAMFVQAFPNPVTDKLMIEFHAPESAILQLSVYNSSGREVPSLSRSLSLSGGYQTIDLDVDSLPSGVYEAVLAIDGQLKTIRFVR